MQGIGPSCLTRRALLGAAGGLLLAGTRAGAQPAQGSSWPEGVFARLELLGAGKADHKQSGLCRAGLLMTLRPGFKTYWRMPGDTGVPPQFSYDGSVNLKHARVLFPAPHRFADGAGGTSIGYAAPEVLFPVHAEPIDPTRPIELHVRADYAVCEKMCIPVSGEARIRLPSSSDETMRIKAAEARVPSVTKLGSNGPLAIRRINRGSAAESLIIDVAIPAGLTPDLFVEAPSPWFFETKSFVPAPGGGQFELVAIERDKAVDCKGVDLVLTLTAGQHAVEVATWLDAALLAP